MLMATVTFPELSNPVMKEYINIHIRWNFCMCCLLSSLAANATSMSNQSRGKSKSPLLKSEKANKSDEEQQKYITRSSHDYVHYKNLIVFAVKLDSNAIFSSKSHCCHC